MRRPRMTKGLIQRLYEGLSYAQEHHAEAIAEDMDWGYGDSEDPEHQKIELERKAYIRDRREMLAQIKKDREWLSRAQAWLEWRSSK